MASRHIFTGEISDDYAQFRPQYPRKMLEGIMAYSRKRGDFQPKLAVDVGCGTGQSTLPLTTVFQQVIGVDISEGQLTGARDTYCDIHNLTFKQSSAEDMSFLADSSVDLIQVATALHWFDKERFYAETRRVLRPSGVIAVCGYFPLLFDNVQISSTFAHFITETLRPYWRKEVELNFHLFKGVELPFEDFQRIDRYNIKQTFSVQAIIGMMKSLSPFKSFIETDSNAKDLFGKFCSDLQEVFDLEIELQPGNEFKHVNTNWPVYLLLGHK